MKKVRFVLLWFGLAALVLFATAGSSAQTGGGEDGVFVVDDEAFELEVIRLTNIERTSRGLTPLLRNSDLTDAARVYTEDMITNGAWNHEGSDGSWPDERACREGYLPYPPYETDDCYAGENIAAGYPTPSSVVLGWMDSPGHRDNILNALYREIGVGHDFGSVYGNYWTMVLGAQPNVLPVFVNHDDAETTSRGVMLTLTKEDVSSWGSIGTITGVKLSEDPAFVGASWQSWAQTKPFTLSSGNETKTVYVRFTDGTNEVTSSDTIVLNEPVPVLAVSPSSLTFLSELGSGVTVPETAVLSIENVGGDVLTWTAVSDLTWLLPNNDAGIAPDSTAVSIDNSGGILNSLGTKTANMTVTATNPDAQNTPQTVPVTVLVVDTIYEIYLPLVQR